MNREQIAVTVAIGVLGIGLIRLMRQRGVTEAEKDSKNVTKSKQAGSLQTTPINTSAVAAVQEPLQALGGLVKSLFPSSSVQNPSSDRLQPYGTPRVAQAAATSPLRPDYSADVRAKDNVVYIQ